MARRASSGFAGRDAPLAGGGERIEFAKPGIPFTVASYGGLHVVDANGRILESRIELVT